MTETRTHFECDEQAQRAYEAGDYKTAAKLWRDAAGLCLGRGRADRYHAKADEAQAKGKSAKA